MWVKLAPTEWPLDRLPCFESPLRTYPRIFVENSCFFLLSLCLGNMKCPDEMFSTVVTKRDHKMAAFLHAPRFFFFFNLVGSPPPTPHFGVELLSVVLFVLGLQELYSVIHRPVSILFQGLTTEVVSGCSVDFPVLFNRSFRIIFGNSVYLLISQLLNVSIPLPFILIIINGFSKSVSLFLCVN